MAGRQKGTSVKPGGYALAAPGPLGGPAGGAPGPMSAAAGSLPSSSGADGDGEGLHYGGEVRGYARGGRIGRVRRGAPAEDSPLATGDPEIHHITPGLPIASGPGSAIDPLGMGWQGAVDTGGPGYGSTSSTSNLDTAALRGQAIREGFASRGRAIREAQTLGSRTPDPNVASSDGSDPTQWHTDPNLQPPPGPNLVNSGQGYQRGGAVNAPSLDFLDVDRVNPEVGKRMDRWAQAVAERAPESTNIEDRRGGESTLGYYGGVIADKARDIWSNITDPLPPQRYQQGGPVQRPTHAVHNEHNQRMIAHFGRRNPQHAKRLLQALRRQHHGLRALANVALSHSYGLRSVGRHELAHGHDAHALHLLNMAHAKVPDGAEVNFSQHDDHHFNANVRRRGRESNFPLNRNQLMQFAIGPAGGFDHTIDNGVEKNLQILQRGRRPPRGYQEGGEVGDGREWDPATQSYFSAGTPPAQAPDPDAQIVRQVVDEDRRDHGLGQAAADWYGQPAGLPAAIRGGVEAVRGALPLGAETERGIEERHRRIRDYITGTGPRAATDKELDDARRSAELEATRTDIPNILRSGRQGQFPTGGRQGAEPITYRGQTPEEAEKLFGPSAGDAVRRELERVSAASDYRPVKLEREAQTPSEPKTATSGMAPQDVETLRREARSRGLTEEQIAERERVIPRRTALGAEPAAPSDLGTTIAAKRPGEIGYTLRPGDEGYVVSGAEQPPAPSVQLPPGRTLQAYQEAERQFPGDRQAQATYLERQPWDPSYPTPEQAEEATRARAESLRQERLMAMATGGKGTGAALATELYRRPELTRQADEKAALQRATLAQRIQEELGRGGRNFTSEAGKNIRQKLKDDPSGKSLAPEEMEILRGVHQRALSSLQGGGGQPAQPAQGGGGIPQVSTAADYNKLQPGQQYYDPNGVLKVKG